MGSDVVVALAAGLGACFLVSAVGAGSLVSFPLLLSLGLGPVAADVTNTVGLVPGRISGRPVVWSIAALVAIGSIVGGWVGAMVGRRLPPAVFRVLVVLFGYVVGVSLLVG